MRIMRIQPRAVTASLALLVMSNSINAEPPAPPSSKPTRPETLTITVDDILTRVDGPKMWTLSGIDYQKTVMAVEDSAYGTVVTYPGAQHLGTAHFLDVPGKPGEVEKENVTELKFYVDEKQVTDVSPHMNLAGNSFRMERKSTIRTLQLSSTAEVRDGVLVETAHLQTVEPIKLQSSYPLMYAWTPAATMYLFGDDKGVQKRGTFKPDGEKAGEGLEKTARWMAVYEPVSGKGGVCYLVRRPENADGWFQYTDAPGIYRKLRIMSFVDSTIPAGFDGTFQSIVGFFNAAPADWEAAAQKRVEELRAYSAKREAK